MMSTRRSPLLNFTAPLVLEPPRHCGLSAVALVPGRHLIGKSEDCAIRVDVDGVVDRHAIILVGENRTVVKSLDARTWVNDGPVAEMALRSGDRLSVGPLTFRIRSATGEEAAAFQSASQLPTERAEAAVVEVPAPLAHMISPTIVASPVESTPPTFVIEDEPIIESVAEPEVAIHPTDVMPDNQETSRSDRELIDSRLNELEQRLVELQQSRVVSQPATSPREIAIAESAEVTRQLDLRHEELQRQSDQIAVETRRLQERADHVAEREVQVERRRHELTQEAERIATATNAAREALSVEHALHLKTWQEWDATYIRMTSDLTSRFEVLECQQTTLQAESERVNTARAELQRTRSDCEQSRHGLTEEQLNLANDRAELSVLKSRVEAQQKQLLREADEHDSRRQLDLLEIGRRQAELLQAQQELESERLAILAERTTHLHRLDQENQRRASLQEMFEKDRQLAASERDELLRLKSELERTRSELESERSRIHVVRDQNHETRVEIEDLRSRCHTAEQELAQFRSQWVELQSSKLKEQSPANALPEAQPEAVFDQQVLIEEPSSNTARDFADHAPETISAQTVTEVPVPSYFPDVFENPESSSPFESTFAPWSISPAIESEVPAALPPVPPPLPAVNAETTEDFSAAVDWASLSSVHHNFGGDSASGMTHTGRGTDAGYSYRNSGGAESAYFPPPNELSAWPIPESKLGMGAPSVFGTDPWANVSASFESTPSTFHDAASGKFDYGQAIDPWANPVNTDSRNAVSDVDTAIDSHQFEGSFPAPYSATMEPSDSAAGFAILDQLMAGHSAPLDHVDETMAAINRNFGVPIESPQAESSESALPAWWNQQPNTVEEPSPVEAGHPNWVVDALRNSPTEASPPTSEAPTSDLRSQLAMLFDLPTSALDEKAKESPAPVEPKHSAPEVDASRSRDEVRPASESVSKVEAPSFAASPHDTTPSATDDSVEEFMARLLARSRGNADDMVASAASKSSTASVPVPSVSAPQIESVPLTELESADRSHLMAEPKHKQNKQEVRENLQSFRQVAHLSARSALAKYSHHQLLNATIAKGVLFGISAVSTGVFLMDPLWGNSFQLWKAGACFLATVLSGMETRRSWKKLRGPLGGPAHQESHHADESGHKSHDVKVASAPAETTATDGPAISNDVSSASE